MVIDGSSGDRIGTGRREETVTGNDVDREAEVARICADVALEKGAMEVELTIPHLRSSYQTDTAADRGMTRIKTLVTERCPGLPMYTAWGPG